MKQIILLAVLTVCTGLSLHAQKFGYMDSNALIAEMPEVKQADAKLETLQKQLTKQGQQKLQSLQAEYQELQRKEKQGEIAPKALQAEAEKLKQKELELAQYEQDMQNQILSKRQELYQPILDRVNTAIKELAEAEGYTYIFDAASGALLYADESTNVTEQVKAKLLAGGGAQ